MHPFCLKLDIMAHISQKEFETRNWLPIKERLNQCINSVYKIPYSHKQCHHYLDQVFLKAPESGFSLRNSYHKLKQPFCKTSVGQSALSLIGTALWNKIPEEIKRTNSLNTFTHKLKEYYLKEIEKSSF